MKNRNYFYVPKEPKQSEYFEPHNFPYFCEYELHFYAERADYEVLKRLLEEFPEDVNCVNAQGYTPLALVTKTIWDEHTKEEKNVMRLLLSYGADPMMDHFDGKPIAMHAFKNGDAEVMRIFAEHIENIDTYFDGYTPLYYAVTQCEIELAKYCLDRQADVHQMYSRNMTLIHIAMDTHNYSMVPLLLEHGCDVNARMAGGHTALHMAAWSYNAHSVLKTLIDFNADVNAQNDDGDTPLNRMAQQDYLDYDSFKTLLKSGCDVNKPDFNGMTPLHNISFCYKSRKRDRKNCKNFIHTLLRKDANVFAVNNFGETVVDTALRSNRLDLAEIFIKYLTPLLLGRYQENDVMVHSFERHPKFRNIAKKCVAEYSKLNESISGTTFTYRDLLKDYRRVVKSATDENVARAIKQMMNRRSRLYEDELNRECQKVLDLAQMLILLTDIFECILPGPCVDKILEYISPRDCEQSFRPNMIVRKIPKFNRYFANKKVYYLLYASS